MDEIQEMLKDCSICEKYEYDQEVDTLAATTSNRSLILHPIEKHKEDEHHYQPCESKIKELYRSIEDLTCSSMEFIGVPLVVNLDETDGLKNIFEQTKGFKVGLIDSTYTSKRRSNEYADSFNREPIFDYVHNCNREVKLSSHGFVCASILAGKSQKGDYFGLCDQEIRGVVPDVQLYVYPFGCVSCGKQPWMISKAIELAMRDKVKVISLSQGLQAVTFEDFEDDWLFEEDEIAQKSLEAFKDNILICVSAGNEGPAPESIIYGMPWCVNVGACTTGNILTTEVSIGIKGKPPPGVQVLATEVDEKHGEIMILERLEGIAMNILGNPFLKLRISPEVRQDKEGYLIAFQDSVVLKRASETQRQRLCVLNTTKRSMASLSRENCKKIREWQDKFRENPKRDIYVSISKSKTSKDERGTYIPEYSASGPSLKYPEIVMPDLVAPGSCIHASHSESIPFGSVLKKTNDAVEDVEIHNKQRIMTGTSLATSHLAGLFVALLSNRPDWTPSMAKSASITTAQSFLVKGIPGNEFRFGAGLMQLKEALDPVLVYNETHENFEKYAMRKLHIYRLNLPSFSASYTQSHKACEVVFHRRLTNIDNRNVEYEAAITVYQNSLDKKASFEVSPPTLKFSPKDEKSFTIKVILCPRPMGHLSALLTWKETTSNHLVTSPIHLYHKSSYDRRIWYDSEIQTKKRDAFEARQKEANDKGKAKMKEGDNKGKGKLSGNEGVRISGAKRSR